jgi:hypothetical protein
LKEKNPTNLASISHFQSVVHSVVISAVLSAFFFSLFKKMKAESLKQYALPISSLRHTKEMLFTNPDQIFILRGMNSGKAAKEPYTNSFVILFQDEEGADTCTGYSL